MIILIMINDNKNNNDDDDDDVDDDDDDFDKDDFDDDDDDDDNDDDNDDFYFMILVTLSFRTPPQKTDVSQPSQFLMQQVMHGGGGWGQYLTLTSIEEVTQPWQTSFCDLNTLETRAIQIKHLSWYRMNRSSIVCSPILKQFAWASHASIESIESADRRKKSSLSEPISTCSIQSFPDIDSSARIFWLRAQEPRPWPQPADSKPLVHSFIDRSKANKGRSKKLLLKLWKVCSKKNLKAIGRHMFFVATACSIHVSKKYQKDSKSSFHHNAQVP